MKEKFIDNCIKLITKYKHYSKKDIMKIRYGLEGIYLTIYKMIILIVLALLLGIIKEFLLVIIFFNILRFTGFGFHAEKSYQCLIVSLLEFVLLPFILLQICIPNYLYYLICSICLSSYLLYAPADTIKRPLKNRKKRIIRKICTLLIGIIYTFLIIKVSNNFFSKSLLCALIIETLAINPFIYKLFKQPYRNYLNCNV